MMWWWSTRYYLKTIPSIVDSSLIEVRKASCDARVKRWSQQIQRRNWPLFLRSQIPDFCDNELVGRGMSSLLGAFKSDYNFRALCTQEMEDPAGILVPGPMESLPALSAIRSFISLGLQLPATSNLTQAVPFPSAVPWTFGCMWHMLVTGEVTGSS